MYNNKNDVEDENEFVLIDDVKMRSMMGMMQMCLMILWKLLNLHLMVGRFFILITHPLLALNFPGIGSANAFLQNLFLKNRAIILIPKFLA